MWAAGILIPVANGNPCYLSVEVARSLATSVAQRSSYCLSTAVFLGARASCSHVLDLAPEPASSHPSVAGCRQSRNEVPTAQHRHGDPNHAQNEHRRRIVTRTEAP
jgi:hypothetical protein